MAQTLTERVTALERVVDTHATRLAAVERYVRRVDNAQALGTNLLTDLKREFDRDTALLKREVEDLKAWREEWKRGSDEFGRRLWMIVPPILAAVVSSALTGLITYLLRR